MCALFLSSLQTFPLNLPCSFWIPSFINIVISHVYRCFTKNNLPVYIMLLVCLFSNLTIWYYIIQSNFIFFIKFLKFYSLRGCKNFTPNWLLWLRLLESLKYSCFPKHWFTSFDVWNRGLMDSIAILFLVFSWVVILNSYIFPTTLCNDSLFSTFPSIHTLEIIKMCNTSNVLFTIPCV